MTDKHGSSYDGATPLSDPKRENFARNIALGQFETQTEAYMDSHPNAKRRSAATLAGRLLKEVDVQLRVEFIKNEASVDIITAAKANNYFMVRQQVERLEKIIVEAERDRNYTIAINARFKLLEMFGAGDNPSMMHQTVNGENFDPNAADTTPNDGSKPPSEGSVVQMGQAFAAHRQKHA